MSVVFILVFAAIIIAAAFLFAFVWAVRNGQYDDTYTPSVRILFDEPLKEEVKIAEQTEAEKIKKDNKKGGSPKIQSRKTNLDIEAETLSRT